MSIQKSFRLFTVVFAASLYLILTTAAFGQSTGAIQGTVTDSSGAVVPNATVTVSDPAHGVTETQATGSAGLYYVPSLPVGTYNVEVKATGLAPTEVKGLILDVGQTVTQNFNLTVASSTQVVEVEASAPLVDASTASLEQVVNAKQVQEIPLNGRHFVDLSELTVGTVTPPATSSLAYPLRGQGSFSFNSAGGREDTVNFMVNGINMNDANNQQVTFQPTIATVDEFKADNQTFSAEYGRNSGTIVNVATRAGVNTWHGEAYEFLRNDYFDARNFANPTNTVSSTGVLTPNPESEFIRNQFGGDGGGAIKKDKTFVYLSYEGLRQRQSLPTTTTTLTTAQLAQAESTSDAQIKALLPLIPVPNDGVNQYAYSMSVPVNISQGTANISQLFSDRQRLNFYYAIQQDQRDEPSATDGNSFPNEGDMRGARRQLWSLTDSWVLTPTLVNELRLGANRIHIVFNPDNMFNPVSYGIDSGVSGPVGLPQITVSGAFTFGGNSGFPQGRGDTTYVLSDTMSWVHGTHTIKFGGEERLENSNNFSATPGTFTFPSVTAFLADQASAFGVTASNRSNREYMNALGFFITDSWKTTGRLTLTLGLRYDWNGTPWEAENRYSVFNPVLDSLEYVGKNGGPSEPYNQSALNFQPRVGFAYDPFGKGRFLIRGAYGIMLDEPGFGLVTSLAGNPPSATAVSFVNSTAVPYVTLGDAYQAAGGAIALTSVAANYKDAYVSEWNFGIEQQVGDSTKFTARYVGSKGTDLNVERNYNQYVNGVHPYATLSMASPIDPGATLSNISVNESVGNSSYNALWVTAEKRLAKGLIFNASESWSKSIDDNSRNYQGVVIENSLCIVCDRGLSDFNAASRFVISGIYQLPFEGNRLKSGWQISLLEQTQSGSPLNVKTLTSSFTGNANLRPNVTGPVMVGFVPATNGSATSIQYIDNPSVFVNQGSAFGNLGRNALIGPGYSDLDFAITKNTRISERFTFQIRADAFDALNQTNFTNPGLTIGSSTLGIITGGTRFPPSDFGSSRQLQLSAKVLF